MLMIQDVLVVIGREEIPFEDEYRAFGERVGECPGVRLAAFTWAPHGSGEGYEAVALVAVDDVDALARHQERLATGELVAERCRLEAQLHEATSSVGVIAGWSPLLDDDLATADEHPPTLLRLDTFGLGGPSGAAVDELDRHREKDDESALLEPIACWTPLLGDLDASSVTVLSRLRSTDGLRSAIAEGLDTWPGEPAVSAAVSHQTRLLRSVAWSPIR